MATKHNTQILVKVAKLYYLDGRSQQQIAQELNVSRSLIATYLAKAKDTGIVKIHYTINDPYENDDALSERLCGLFPVKKCRVIPSGFKDAASAAKLAAECAVDIVDGIIEDGNVVGIAWGFTCYEFMTAFNTQRQFGGVTVVPLTGSSYHTAYAFQLNEMVRIFAEKVKGKAVFIYAPAVTSSEEEKMLYMQSSQMEFVDQHWRDIDLAVISVGAPPSRGGPGPVEFGEDAFRAFLNPGMAVGDICARPINIYGEFIQDSYSGRIIGISPEDLKRSKYNLCIAAGVNKTFSIIGGLKTGLIDEFVCDEYTAKRILQVTEWEEFDAVAKR